MPKLIVTEGPGKGKQFELDQAAILGRLDTNDIPVHDAKASREHAKIYKQGTKFALVDLNSSNGTFVNGRRVTKHMLEPGDEITIGLVALRFEDAEAEAAKATAGKRKSLDEVFAAKPEAGAAGGGDKAPEIVLSGHKPIQYNRVKPGTPIIGFDLDQLSEGARLLVYVLLIVVFGGLMWLAYSLVAV